MELQRNGEFICETKRKKGFISTVCKKLGQGDRWFVVDPIGGNGGLLLGWEKEVFIYQIMNTTFSIELEFEISGTEGKMWAIFVYASNRDRIRTEQRQELLVRKEQWGNSWILGGDLNDIRSSEEKKRGRIRSESNCISFKEFIEKMKSPLFSLAKIPTRSEGQVCREIEGGVEQTNPNMWGYIW